MPKKAKHDPEEAFLRCLAHLKRLRYGQIRRMLMALTKASDEDVYLKFTYPTMEHLKSRLYELRKAGWKIESRPIAEVGTWRRVKLCDATGMTHHLYKKQPVKHAPFTRAHCHRIDQEFLRDFRNWFEGARKVGAVSMLPGGKPFAPDAVKDLLKMMKLWDIGHRGMKYAGFPPDSHRKGALATNKKRREKKLLEEQE